VGLRNGAMHVSSIIKEDIMHFRIRGLPVETFAPLFHLSGAECDARPRSGPGRG
jgi:hypothetical protein